TATPRKATERSAAPPSRRPSAPPSASPSSSTPARTAVVNTPHFSTPAAPAQAYYCTTGVDPGQSTLARSLRGTPRHRPDTVCADIREAARAAVRHMIALLAVEHGLEREDAYILCSVAGDLRMHEVVDMPNYVIGMMMPKSIFTNPGQTGVLSV
ncbi:hypothetical protein EVJ58_g10048, partial [Rhodofomes roseus]